MGSPQSKFADLHKNGKNVAARRRQESASLRKQSYWAIRQSDERIAKANDAINRAMSKLKVAGQLHENAEPKPDPFLAWGELLIHGIQNSKRRADD